MTRLLPLALTLLLAGPTGAAPWPDPPDFPSPGPETMARLEAGEILIENIRIDEAGGAARALTLFHVDAERLWSVIGDCSANVRFVRGMEACEVLEETPRSARTRQRLKPYRLLPAMEYVFETVREPHEWIRIRLVEGDLRALEGNWRFLPVREGLLVSHELRVQPAWPVPRWMARRAVERDLGDLMACLRWETGGWSDPRQRGRDRQRCPDGGAGGIQP